MVASSSSERRLTCSPILGTPTRARSSRPRLAASGILRIFASCKRPDRCRSGRFVPMPVLPNIAKYADELTAIRHDLHENPEIGFEEVRTSGIIADLLRSWGVDEVHTGIGKTGVV